MPRVLGYDIEPQNAIGSPFILQSRIVAAVFYIALSTKYSGKFLSSLVFSRCL